MKLALICLLFAFAYGQDVVTISGVDVEPAEGEDPEKGDEIDVSGLGGDPRTTAAIPDDGLLPEWCASPVGQKCDVSYDIGVFDESGAINCLYTCQMKSCLSAQFHDGHCSLSSERCDTLVAGEGTNYHRLKEGEEGQCPEGTSPIGLKKYEPANHYCKGVGVECPGEDIFPSRFTPTLRQCTTDCNIQRRCHTVHYHDKICHLRGNRCTADQLIDAPGAIDLYRLTKGEECPAGRPPYVEEVIPYTGKFCMIKNRSCPGHDLYRKPQNIHPLEQCLIKCNKIKTCGSVEFTDNRCSPKDYRCSDDELVDAPGAINLMRLEEGEECPGNREPPPVLKPWSGAFCSKKGRECAGFDMEGMPVDAVDLVDCLTKCVKADGCATVFFADGKCSLKNKNCEEADLTESQGDTYYRLRAGEACPEPTPPETCQENASYAHDASACPNTCDARDAASTCPVESASGCQCNDGFVKAADSDACIPVSECGCVDEAGNKHAVGESWGSADCQHKYECQLDSEDQPAVTTTANECGENEECDGEGKCVCVEAYELKDGICEPVVDCGNHSTFDPKASTTPNICHHPARAAAGNETAPGCPCNDGYILDKEDGQCVAYSDCGCKDDDGHEFPTGDEWLNEDCTKSLTCIAQSDAHPAINATSNSCPEHASCKAEEGRGACGCDEGYTLQLDGTCKPDKDCADPTVYNPNGSLCPNTCRTPDRASECEAQDGPTCDCPAGTLLNDDDMCVETMACPCYDDQGQIRGPGEEWMTYDCNGMATCAVNSVNVTNAPSVVVTPHSCKENAVCDRESGFSQCICAEGFVLASDGESCVPETPPCEEQLRDKVKDFVADILAILSGGCGSCSDTCQNPNGSKNCPVTSKICSCGQKGFLFDSLLAKCIPADECGCYDNDGLAHSAGSSWLSDDCQHKKTCKSEGDGAPTIVSEPFECESCDGAGSCSDHVTNHEADVTAEAVEQSPVEV